MLRVYRGARERAVNYMGVVSGIPESPVADPVSVGTIQPMSGSHATRGSVSTYSERDLAVAKVDLSRRWISTLDLDEDVPYWRTLEEDEEVQKALREAGLA